MGRAKSVTTKERLTLVVSKRTKRRIVRLQKTIDADSMSEVIRRALEHFENSLKARDNLRIKETT